VSINYNGSIVSVVSSQAPSGVIVDGVGVGQKKGGLTEIRRYSAITKDWVLLGDEIFSEAEGDVRHTVLSYGGYTCATVGSVDSTDTGNIRVHRYSAADNSWNQLGDRFAITGSSSGWGSHPIISMYSDDGDNIIVAIGAYNADPNLTDISMGAVRVYSHSIDTVGDSSWNQLGTELVGAVDAADTADTTVYFGKSFCLNSDDGTILAVGADHKNADGDDNKGQVQVYKYDATADTWGQRGQNLDGEAASDSFGTSVSLNANGTILAVGAIYNDNVATNAGHVRVYRYSYDTAVWVQIGEDIYGVASENDAQSGTVVSLDSTGYILTVSAPYADIDDSSVSEGGRISRYRFYDNAWSQMGSDIVGYAANQRVGSQMSSSADGSTVIWGSTTVWENDDSDGDRLGKAAVYTFS
jgi:hypothetical protein